MIKSIKAKFSQPLLLMICFALFCCLSACGGSQDSGSDSGGTSTGYSIDISNDTDSDVAAGENHIITARVTDESYSAAVGVTVNFSFFSNKSGATLDAGSGITDGAGQTANGVVKIEGG